MSRYLQLRKHALTEIQESYLQFKIGLNYIHNIKLGEEFKRNANNEEQ